MNVLQTLLPLAVRAALAAGEDILSVYRDPATDFGIEYKADDSPLTRADKAAHGRILSFLVPAGIPVLSEDGAATDLQQGRLPQPLVRRPPKRFPLTSYPPKPSSR